jgi:hypothetical protein
MVESDTQRRVLELHNQMFLSPQVFSYRWNIDNETLAEICCLSKATTYHWLGGQASRRPAGLPYQRIMALADLLLENAEQACPLLEGWQARRSSS